MKLQLFATTASGFEPLLTEELRTLGGENVRPGHAGVAFSGSFSLAMKVCLWSRVAGRLLWPIAKIPATATDLFHAGLSALPWEEHLADGATLAVDFVGTNGIFRNPHFGALSVKDAVVDYFRALGRPRPSVNTEQPDLRIHVRLQGDRARVSLDLSGSRLHRRGWRVSPSDANMRETLAAGILMMAGWPEVAKAGGAFADLMCGSGTFPIEAAWVAADVAPGLIRPSFGFQKLPWFEPADWEIVLTEARDRARAGLARLSPILAWDANSSALTAAHKNAEAAGLGDHIRFERLSVAQLRQIEDMPFGLVMANPPYGVRQGEKDDLLFLYQKLGEKMRGCFPGWRRAVFTARSDFVNNLGMRPTQEHNLYNGAIPCRLWIYEPTSITAPTLDNAQIRVDQTHFGNRLKKNLKRLGAWAKREEIECFRVYDADMPEYAVAIDLYGAWVHIQEYHAPKTVDPQKAKQRFSEVVEGVSKVLGTPEERLCIKVRKPQKGVSQYEKLGDEKAFLAVSEGGLKFLVNLEDYLDSGLFLDQRLLRQKIRKLARGRRFLNLFGYTGSATVYAADGGAKETVLVDISHTYLTWAERNLALNGYELGAQHQLIQDDCVAWMRHQKSQFDLIFLAPPTFSNSKRMAKDLDIMRDYGALLSYCCALLSPGGILIFLTHARRFRLDPDKVPSDITCTEITAQTIPLDFQRKSAFHRAWEMQRNWP